MCRIVGVEPNETARASVAVASGGAMPNPPLPDQLRQEALAALAAAHGNKSEAARALRLSRKTFCDRLETALRLGNTEVKVTPLGRVVIDDFTDGIVLVGSDPHYLPGHLTTAQKAFVAFVKEYKPQIVVMNGDVLDAATISRHPPTGWQKRPTVAEEIAESQERLGEVAKAAGGARLIWPRGNHDIRFETRLASVAPEYANVNGVSLTGHFPDWEQCWSVFIGGPQGCVIKHRFRGGIHAGHNNALWSGRSIVTGHTHALKVTPIRDYNGTRYGAEFGTLAEPYDDQFSYNEDSPRSWASGFGMLTFRDGRLLPPELIEVTGENEVVFRGSVLTV